MSFVQSVEPKIQTIMPSKHQWILLVHLHLYQASSYTGLTVNVEYVCFSNFHQLPPPPPTSLYCYSVSLPENLLATRS